MSGRVRIKVADGDRDVQTDSIVYVAKNVEHKFLSIEEERCPEPFEGLTVIVFFAPEAYSNQPS